MNDELSGQLTQDWAIPTYAQPMLYVQGEGDAMPIEGRTGLFMLDVASPLITIRWGGADGAALTQIRWQPDSLEWDGSACIGGYVDAIHLTQTVDMPMNILYLGGHPLLQEIKPYVASTFRKESPNFKPNFNRGLATNLKETYTTWLLPQDSPLIHTAQLALIHNFRVHFYGHLVDEDSLWWKQFALPIMLEAITVFSS